VFRFEPSFKLDLVALAMLDRVGRYLMRSEDRRRSGVNVDGIGEQPLLEREPQRR
jgi:hypothetical protein